MVKICMFTDGIDIHVILVCHLPEINQNLILTPVVYTNFYFLNLAAYSLSSFSPDPRLISRWMHRLRVLLQERAV